MTPMMTLTGGVSYADLHFRGVARAIATAVIAGEEGVALIDPGPSSTLPVLRATLERAGMTLADVTSVLLTHIHLDHAGASGTLVRANPGLRVFVHERGAPHLADPGKLLASARRLYGDEMDTLWGEFLPVPQRNLVVLTGGERVSVAGRQFDVAYTPGHASHHVSYFNRESGVAFVGDTAGIRVRPEGYILPPTPPPDIDIEAWHASIREIRAWRADTLFVTHFGPSSPAAAHLAEFDDRLDRFATLAKWILDREESEPDREARFIAEIVRELRADLDGDDLAALELMGRLDLSWRGISRYWKKRGAQ
jgi:glyoxylase-like metal-dependent hydrolase (beta-lactamase superfamily II)